MEKTSSPHFYFDLCRERKAQEKGEAAYTPATALVAAMGAALDYIRETGNGSLTAGRDALIANAELCAAMTRAGARLLGLELFAKRSPAAALTAISSPTWVNSSDIIKIMRDRFGVVLANGQGEIKGHLFRIAHLGYYDYLDTIGVLAALEHVITEVTGTSVEFGRAVQAAQKVYAESAVGSSVVRSS